VVDAGFLGAKRHTIFGLVSADVTDAVKRVKDAKLSFTAYLVACLAKTLAEDPSVQAYRKGKNKLVVFHDADVVTMIEPSEGAVAIPHIIREANKKSVKEITNEIRSIQENPGQSEQSSGKMVKLAPKLPRWLRMWFFRWMQRHPEKLREMQGTAMLTPVGMFGKGHAGWGITFLPLHTVGITVGGIQRQPAIINDDEIVPRDFVSLTIAVDHDIVDGAPAARFAKRFVECIESAGLLVEEEEDR
jgi:pyruvate/2-oxoglutarate dehydrogenase complex dihydrolipoamide acyltransferase (E2) component